jgi:hypothetical protein
MITNSHRQMTGILEVYAETRNDGQTGTDPVSTRLPAQGSDETGQESPVVSPDSSPVHKPAFPCRDAQPHRGRPAQ